MPKSCRHFTKKSYIIFYSVSNPGKGLFKDLVTVLKAFVLKGLSLQLFQQN